MIDNNQRLKQIGISIDSILLPKRNIDMTRWAVVACDQYTSEPEYWEEVNNLVQENPSTLRLIYPEVYLEKDSKEDKKKRIETINTTMNSYLNNDILESHTGPVLIERTSNDGKKRVGVMIALDLELYNFKKGSQSLIRATEGTSVDRLPPRVQIRENAILELPHIMVLIDDPDCTVIEPIYHEIDNRINSNLSNNNIISNSDLTNHDIVYNFPLMQNSGHLKGWKIRDNKIIDSFVTALTTLADPEKFQSRYQLDSDAGVLLYAVGDGNHSLATAKTCWENTKKITSAEELENHPARYALVELVNIHDKGLLFEPIHRALFHVSYDQWVQEFKEWHCTKELHVHVTEVSSIENAINLLKEQDSSGKQRVILISENGFSLIVWDNPKHEMAVGSLQCFLDDYIEKHKETSIDYLHGNDTTIRLGSIKGNLGFLLPDVQKESFFPTVIRDGALPRKTFSMGEAHEKRFYVECRKIKAGN